MYHKIKEQNLLYHNMYCESNTVIVLYCHHYGNPNVYSLTGKKLHYHPVFSHLLAFNQTG